MSRFDIVKRVVAGVMLCVLVNVVASVAAVRAAEGDKETLRAVSLLVRHGVISPKYNLPRVKADWPMGFMQLTEVGQKDMYEQGRKLRAKYVDRLGFISPTYRSGEIYVRASGTARAQQTAKMLVIGLYFPGAVSDVSKFNASLNSPAAKEVASAIKVNTMPLNVDKVMRPWTGDARCSKYRNYIKSFPRSKLYQAMAEKHKPFLRRISVATGVNEGKSPAQILYEVNEIYEPLSSLVAHNKPLPASITADDMKQLAALSDWNYHYQFYGKKVGRLTGGNFVKEVIENFDRSIALGDKAPRLSLYSGHQRTILGVDAALGIENAHAKGDLHVGRIVQLGSHYAFELHETAPKSYAVRVVYVTDDGEKAMRIPGCAADMCPLDAFRKAVSGGIAEDWASECSAG